MPTAVGIVALLDEVCRVGSASPSPVVTVSPSPVQKVVTVTVTPPPPTNAFQVSGSGTNTTKPFTITADQWTLNYKYDCSAFGTTGNFAVDVAGSDGSDDVAVNELGAGKSGSTTEYASGTFHLTVNSECDWTIRVTVP